MSCLTTFPEEVYPADRLAAAVKAGAFELDRARALMWMAQLAYEATAPEPRKLEGILERWGFGCRARLSHGKIEGYVAEGDGALVVAFAGTDPLVFENVITDVDIRTAQGGANRGFRDGVEGVRGPLVDALRADGGRKPLFLTGHSLGGALAAVAASRLTAPDGAARAAVETERIEGVVTFGMPRPGDDEFAEDYRARGLWDKTVRLRHGSDIVPTVPPACSGLFGLLEFRHVGQLLPCDRSGEFAGSAVLSDPVDRISKIPLVETFELIDEERRRRLDPHWFSRNRGPRWPGDAVAAGLADRLPLFVRDHLQDRYLEALGVRFAPSAEAGAGESAGDIGASLEALKRSIGRWLNR